MASSPVHAAQTHYEALDVPEDASDEQIKAAWRRLALKYHPDKLAHCSPEEKEEGDRIFMRGRQAHDILMDKKKRKDYDRELRRYGADPLERQQTLSVQLWTAGRGERPLPGQEMERWKTQVIMTMRKEYGDMGELRVHERGPAYVEVDRKKVDDRFKSRNRMELSIPGERGLLLKITISSKDAEERTRQGFPPRPVDKAEERRSPRRPSPPGRREHRSRSRSRSSSRPRTRRSRSPNGNRRKRSPARPWKRPRDDLSHRRSRSRSPAKSKYEEEKTRAEMERLKAELERLKKQTQLEEQLTKARQELSGNGNSVPPRQRSPPPPYHGPNSVGGSATTSTGAAGSGGARCCWQCRTMCNEGDFCTNCGGSLFRLGAANRRPPQCPEGIIFCAKCGLKGPRQPLCPRCRFANPVFEKADPNQAA